MDATTESSSGPDLILRLNAIDIAVIVVYFLLVMGVGIWVSHYVQIQIRRRYSVPDVRKISDGLARTRCTLNNGHNICGDFALLVIC